MHSHWLFRGKYEVCLLIGCLEVSMLSHCCLEASMISNFLLRGKYALSLVA